MTIFDYLPFLFTSVDRRRIIICRILLFLGAIFFAVMTALAVYVEGKRISVHDTTFESASKARHTQSHRTQTFSPPPWHLPRTLPSHHGLVAFLQNQAIPVKSHLTRSPCIAPSGLSRHQPHSLRKLLGL